MSTFGSFAGTVTSISDFFGGSHIPSECYKLMTVQNTDGSIVNFEIAPTTYFIDHIIISVGDPVIGYYDANAPAIMIYPPQYQAVVISKLSQNLNVKVDYFNTQLLSSDGTLKLLLSPFTLILQENGQLFTSSPANHNLIVEYGAATRSIPAQTVPYRIIVLCRSSGPL
jgi:hypothetical protein